MGLRFPSAEWVEELMVRLNADEEFKRVGSKWEGDVNIVVEPGPGLPESQVIYLDTWHGSCRSVGVSDESGKRPAQFEIKAPLVNWKSVLTQEIGPIQAMMSGKVRVYGNLAYILRNVGSTSRLVEVAATIPTEWAP
jgi:putative sterol carrier protein